MHTLFQQGNKRLKNILFCLFKICPVGNLWTTLFITLKTFHATAKLKIACFLPPSKTEHFRLFYSDLSNLIKGSFVLLYRQNLLHYLLG